MRRMHMAEQTPDIIKTVAKNVKAERLRAGFSQQRLAEKTGLSERYISRLESEPQNIKIDKVESIALAIGIAPARLLQPLECTESFNQSLMPSIAHRLTEAMRLLQSVHVY